MLLSFFSLVFSTDLQPPEDDSNTSSALIASNPTTTPKKTPQKDESSPSILEAYADAAQKGDLPNF